MHSENVLDICPKSPDSKDPLTGNIVKRVQTLFRSELQHRYHICDHFEGN